MIYRLTLKLKSGIADLLDLKGLRRKEIFKSG